MNRIQKMKQMRLHQEGHHIIVTVFLLLVILNALVYRFFPCVVSSAILGIVSLSFFLLIVNFFRCPKRPIITDVSNKIFAPADGRVVVIEETVEQEYFKEKRLMISIFMSITNVHANWYPCEGEVTYVEHKNGKYLKAFLPKASTDNERALIAVRTPSGVEILAKQIAGAVARRVVTYAEKGEPAHVNEQLGFIKFGSRVDVYLPLSAKPTVKIGDLTTGSQTIIAELIQTEKES
ncbi:MAG: phosphatidylserine decarboxylase family protein [Bacteroidaceae bacterium]